MGWFIWACVNFVWTRFLLSLAPKFGLQFNWKNIQHSKQNHHWFQSIKFHNTQLLIEVSEHVCGADTRGFFYIETLTAFVFCRNFCASDLSTFRRKWCISELSSSGISVETPIFRIFRKIISTAPATTHAASQWMNELNWPKREDTKYKTYGIRKWTMNDQEWIELSSVFWKKHSILEKCTFIMKFNWLKLL